MMWIGLFVLTLVMMPVTPILVLLALPFARRTGPNVFPAWLQWLNTPDDPGPGQGLLQNPTVVKVFELPITFLTWIRNTLPPTWTAALSGVGYTIAGIQAVGFYLKTWYWLGFRNQINGLFAVLCAKYDGTPVIERTVWKLKVYSVPGYSEWTWPNRRVSFGWKVQTLKTAKVGDPIWWVCMPAFWLARNY